MRRWPWIPILALVTGWVAAGCGEPRVIENRTATIVELTGPFSAEPMSVDPVLAGRFDGSCRQRTASARAPVLVLLDARGLGIATLLYATADGFAIECRVAIDADGSVSVVRVFSAPADPAVGVRGAVQPLTGEFWALGRDRTGYIFESGLVAGLVADVVIVFGADRQIRASIGNGFYAVSWPDGFGAHERRAYDVNGTLIPGRP